MGTSSTPIKNILDFENAHGGDLRSILDIQREWQLDEIDALVDLHQAEHAGTIDASLVLGDALHGDGLRDQISAELKAAFAGLMKEKADTYSEIRAILRERISSVDGNCLSFDDPRIQGFVSKLKGQIGENLFARHIGPAARLATSGSQEGWDIAVRQSNGLHEYIQVKLYKDPVDVVAQMRAVQRKVVAGTLEGWNGETVHQVNFAVPANIAERVRELTEGHPELHAIHVHSIPTSSAAAAACVEEGLSNVGPGELSHFFDELLGGALAAGSLHAMVNGFLWYKGAKEFSEAIASITANTALSTSCIAAGLIAESLINTAILASAVGLGSRLLIGRFARSRWNFSEFMEYSIAHSNLQIARLQELSHLSLGASQDSCSIAANSFAK